MMGVPVPAPKTMRLADGRVLAWYEFGDGSGVPCLYMPGTPESGLAGGCYAQAALDAGVRLISVDRPGYGHSDFAPGRSLRGWAADIEQLAGHLGLQRYAVAGESGGGPHAVVVSLALAASVTVTVLIGGMGPGNEPWVRKGMRPTNVIFYYLARYAPGLLRLPLLAMRYALDRPRLTAWLESQAPAADRRIAEDPEYHIRHQAVPDALRAGTAAAAQELALFAKPWHVDLAELTGPIHLWHGSEDNNVPIAIAQALAASLPGAITHFVPGAGHSVGFEHRVEVMQTIAAGSPALTTPAGPARPDHQQEAGH
jgi:pimeloyl-ACP methyl ester carboxylesterase